MSIIANYVVLPPNKPKRLKLTDPHIEERTIRDPKTGMLKTVKALVFKCIEEDGVPVNKVFSTLSVKLARMLMALWERRPGDYIYVEIVRHPMDYATEYEVRPLW